jgi:hypothetical protein
MPKPTPVDELLDHTSLLFGRHKGKTPDQVSEVDPSWLVWAYETIKDKRICSKVLYEACKQDNQEDDSGVDDTYERFARD